LHGNLAAFRMNRLRHDCMFFDLVPKAELGGKRAYTSRKIGGHAAGDDEPNTSARALGEIYLQGT
jgi:hypothetical protein